MNSLFRLLASVAVLIFTTSASAQLPGRGQMGPGGFNNGGGALSPVDRLMAMDANGDGQLTVNEVTDVRMRTVLNRADANQDGMVSRAELTVMAGGQAGGGNRGGVQGAAGPQGFGGNQAFGGNQGFGGQPGFGGPPAGGMPGGPGQQAVGHAPQPVGQILPSAMHDQLGLNADQRRAIAKLQKEVDAQLTKILSPEQQQQLQQLGAGGTGGPQEAGQARARGRAQARGQDPGQATGPDQGRGGRVPVEQ